MKEKSCEPDLTFITKMAINSHFDMVIYNHIWKSLSDI